MIESLKERLLASSKSFIIGVAGDSGSGKTTFAKGIVSLLGRDLVSGFSTDDYHREDREQRIKSGILPLDPDANRLDLFTEHLEKIRERKNIVKPVYNHKTGKFDPDVVFNPTPIVIIEGLHPFYTNEMKRLIDFKIFVDPSRKVKYMWKIRRDIDKRGASPEKIKEQMMAREPLYRQYVDSQKLFADIVVEIQPTRFYVNPVLQLEELVPEKREKYRLKLIQQVLDYPIDQAPISFDIQKLLKGEHRPFHLEYYHDVYYGRKVTVTVMDGEIHYKIVEPLEEHILEHIGSIDKVNVQVRKVEYMNVVEIAQLFICWRFVERLDFLLENKLVHART